MLKNVPGTSGYVPLSPIAREQLLALADKWEQTAKRKFASAKRQARAGSEPAPTTQGPSVEALIQHASFCYINCAEELRRVLNPPVPAFVSENTATKTAMQRLCEG